MPTINAPGKFPPQLHAGCSSDVPRLIFLPCHFSRARALPCASVLALAAASSRISTTGIWGSSRCMTSLSACCRRPWSAASRSIGFAASAVSQLRHSTPLLLCSSSSTHASASPPRPPEYSPCPTPSCTNATGRDGATSEATKMATVESPRVQIDERAPISDQILGVLRAQSSRVMDLFRAWDSDGDALISKKEVGTLPLCHVIH